MPYPSRTSLKKIPPTGAPVNSGVFLNSNRATMVVNANAAIMNALQLRATLSLLSATLDATADGILVVNTDGMITNVNGRFADLFGLHDAVTPPLSSDASREQDRHATLANRSLTQ